MVKKRKRISDAPTAATEKPDEFAPQRPECTLFWFKDQPDSAAKPVSKDGIAAAPFWNKEKALITCSRRCRIIYRKQRDLYLPASTGMTGQALARLYTIRASNTPVNSHPSTKDIAAPPPFPPTVAQHCPFWHLWPAPEAEAALLTAIPD